MSKVQVCFFIDGLDEFDDSGLNETHRMLVDHLQAWVAQSSGNVKLCVSSRTQLPFTDRFSAEQRIKLDNLTKDDVKLMVTSRLEAHPKFMAMKDTDDRECREPISHVTEAAEGIFLWVALVLNSLHRGLNNDDTIEVLQKRVADTPTEMGAFLAQIMNGIEWPHRQGAYLVLAIVLRLTGTLLSNDNQAQGFEYQRHLAWAMGYPPRFKPFISLLASFAIIRALDRGISIDKDFHLNDLGLEKAGDSASNKISKDKLAAAVMTRCGVLLEVVHESVKFMHRSIPEFLQAYLRNHSETTQHLDDHKVTTALAWACLFEAKCRRENDIHSNGYIALMLSSHFPELRGGLSFAYGRRLDVYLQAIRLAKLNGDCESLFQLLLAIADASASPFDEPSGSYSVRSYFCKRALSFATTLTDVGLEDIVLLSILAAMALEYGRRFLLAN